MGKRRIKTPEKIIEKLFIDIDDESYYNYNIHQAEDSESIQFKDTECTQSFYQRETLSVKEILIFNVLKPIKKITKNKIWFAKHKFALKRIMKASCPDWY